MKMSAKKIYAGMLTSKLQIASINFFRCSGCQANRDIFFSANAISYARASERRAARNSNSKIVFQLLDRITASPKMGLHELEDQTH